MDRRDELNAALDPAVVAKIAAHYRHARAKYPHFADRLEAAKAAVRGDKVHAVEECYDAIAVQLWMIDALEGRQALGDPAKEDAKTEGAIQ